MTSMKKNQDILSEHSVNVYSNMLHLRVKIRFYFSVSIKPLGETKKNLLSHLHVKSYSHLASQWAVGHRTHQVLACVEIVRANTEGLSHILAQSHLLAIIPSICH